MIESSIVRVDLRVDMQVLACMHVLVNVDGSVDVGVNVCVRTISRRASQTPDRVRETEGEEFFTRFSTKSYAIAVNIVVYALTH